METWILKQVQDEGGGVLNSNSIWRIITDDDQDASLARGPSRRLAQAEMVGPRGIEINDRAANFGVSRQAVSAVLNGRAALSAQMALRFERAFGVKADTLLRMQASYELAQAHTVVDDEPIRVYG